MPVPEPDVVTHPIVESLKAEISEAIELQRAHFPNDDEVTLHHRAEKFRSQRYKEGRWPDFAVVAQEEAAENAVADETSRGWPNLEISEGGEAAIFEQVLNKPQ